MATKPVDPAWTAFVEADVPPDIDVAMGQRFVNSRYDVWVRRLPPPMGEWLSIRRLDGEPIHDWRELQRIKNELAGPETEAVELYPAESRLVDLSNRYHLWCLRPGARFPFGMPARAVSEEAIAGDRQRPWPKDTRPPDLMSDFGERAAAFYEDPRVLRVKPDGTVKLG